MPVNGERLNGRIAELAEIGRTAEGGVTRMSLTPEYIAARERVAGWMEEAGLVPRVDAVGSLIGRREGRAPGLPAIAIGSHIDTVINGGRYDGTLGVLGGIEVAQALQEDGVRLSHPLEVISFMEEEGTRWGANMLGSRLMLGLMDEAELKRRTDRQGLTIWDAMQAAGLAPERFRDAVRDPKEFAAYLEMHIEQGAVLESKGLPVGVVTGIAGPLFLALRLKGRTDHAGATPMNLRRDALVGAAQLVLLAQRLGRETAPTSVATVGRLEVKPGAVNAIPGEVFMTFDVRDIYEENRDRMEARLREAIQEVARAENLEWELEITARHKPVLLPEQIVALVAQACEGAGVPAHRLPSGAGHDAQVMASVTGVGMIFVRSKDGISHSHLEYTDPQDIELGTGVLHRAVLALDVRP